MTVAVAVLKNGVAALAADSLVNFGGQRFVVENCRFNKIYRIGESLMVWSGWSLYGEMLDAFLAALEPKPNLSSEAELFKFFVHFWRAMRDDYTFMYTRAAVDGQPFVNLDSVFLLINRAGIFRVASDMDVTQFGQYCAIGSGSKYALGALRILYEQSEDPTEIARRATQVGIDFDVECGGPIDVASLRAEAPGPAR